MPSNMRTAALTASVLAQISDQFTFVREGDVNSWSYLSPLGGKNIFRLYNDSPDGTWDIIIDGRIDPSDPSLRHLSSMEAAKERVAEHLAEDIYAAELLIWQAGTAKLISPKVGQLCA